MFLMNKFFDGDFLKFGLQVLEFMQEDQEDRIDPMIYIFPRMTKCTFFKYGVSGEVKEGKGGSFCWSGDVLITFNDLQVERHDAICILPLNVVNEKVYIFLWFWFILLAILSAITIFYRVIIIFSPRMRVYLLRLRFR